jgi:cytochrome P450
VVTEYKAMREILSQDEALSFPGGATAELMGAQDTGWGQYIQRFMLVRNREDHARLRGSVAEAFTPRAVQRFRPLMRQTVTELLDEWAPKGRFDFADFAANFPVRIMFDLIGADPALVPVIRKAMEVYGMSFAMDPTKMPLIEEHFQAMDRFVVDRIAERGTAGGHDDLLDDLIAAHTSGALSERELRDMLIFLFGAGYDTSKNQLTLITHALLNHPDIWDRCGEDAEYCHSVVEEGLRYASPSNTFRTLKTDIEYRGVTLPAGSFVVFPLTIAGREEAFFPNAEGFHPDRKQVDRHLAFGRGMHICLGQFLARAVLEEGLHLIARRLKNLRLDGEVTWRPFPGVWGVLELPIAFDDAGKA